MADREDEIREAGVPPEAAVSAGLPSRSERAAAKREAEHASSSPASDVFSRERLLDPLQAERISGQPVHVVAGALHGYDGETLTRGELDRLVGDYLEREIPAESDE